MFINLFVYAAVADDRAGSSCRLSHGQPHFKFAAGCSSALRSPGCGLKSELLSCRSEARSLQTDIVLLLLSTWLRQNYTAQDVSRVRRFSKWPCDQNLHHVRSCNMQQYFADLPCENLKNWKLWHVQAKRAPFFLPYEWEGGDPAEDDVTMCRRS